MESRELRPKINSFARSLSRVALLFSSLTGSDGVKAFLEAHNHEIDEKPYFKELIGLIFVS